MRWHLDGDTILTKTVLSAFPIFSTSIHTALFSENNKMGFVDSSLTNIMMAYFKDKTISKKKTAALLLYTQLDHNYNKHNTQWQHNLLQVFGLFIILLSFKQHPVFFLVE